MPVNLLHAIKGIHYVDERDGGGPNTSVPCVSSSSEESLSKAAIYQRRHERRSNGSAPNLPAHILRHLCKILHACLFFGVVKQVSEHR